MTGIGRPDKSPVGPTGADSTWRSSGSRSQYDLAPGEGGQSFDSVVERMRSGPQDRTAPLAGQPRTSGGAVPISSSGDDVNAAERMDSLLKELDACRNAAMQCRNSSEAQDLIDQLVKAGSTVLDYYALSRPAEPFWSGRPIISGASSQAASLNAKRSITPKTAPQKQS